MRAIGAAQSQQNVTSSSEGSPEDGHVPLPTKSMNNHSQNVNDDCLTIRDRLGPDDIVPSMASRLSHTLQSEIVRKRDLHKLSPYQLSEFMRSFEQRFCDSFYLGCPRSDQRLTLIQFNVFRALVCNTFSMEFSMDWLKAEAVSPWSSTESSKINTAACPPSLRPTSLQRTIPHHPWIDLFPFPKIRDNMLLAESHYDEDELCNNLIDFCDVPTEETGLVVWGEPWDPAGWEVGEMLLKDWAWVIQGCSEIQCSTNFWRRRRGEQVLEFRSLQIQEASP